MYQAKSILIYMFKTNDNFRLNRTFTNQKRKQNIQEDHS